MARTRKGFEPRKTQAPIEARKGTTHSTPVEPQKASPTQAPKSETIPSFTVPPRKETPAQSPKTETTRPISTSSKATRAQIPNTEPEDKHEDKEKINWGVTALAFILGAALGAGVAWGELYLTDHFTPSTTNEAEVTSTDPTPEAEDANGSNDVVPEDAEIPAPPTPASLNMGDIAHTEKMDTIVFDSALVPDPSGQGAPVIRSQVRITNLTDQPQTVTPLDFSFQNPGGSAISAIDNTPDPTAMINPTTIDPHGTWEGPVYFPSTEPVGPSQVIFNLGAGAEGMQFTWATTPAVNV